ncbi:MAG: 50S ribosomal protein L20 [Patescibacteria group bacterium]
MMRVKRGVTSHAKHKKVMAQTKGMIKVRRSSIKKAREALFKAWSYQYRDRRNKKRDIRRLWITRIGNATKINGLSYSKFTAGLKSKKIELDRKILAELAVNQPDIFARIVEKVK